MLEWKEREHGNDFEESMQYLGMMLMLKNYGLLKYFKTQCMQKQVCLLEHIVSLWDVNEPSFCVGPQTLKMNWRTFPS